jgi:hypothetical protein
LNKPNEELAQFHFKDASDVEITSSSPLNTSSPFLFLEGSETKNVILMNNNFKELGNIVEHDGSIDGSEITELNNLKK